MAWLRAKTCVFFLFSLMTFGQAYPYSYAWAEGRHAECGCNLSGRACIHGCDLEHRAKSQLHGEHGHAGQGHDHDAAMNHHHESPKSAALDSNEDEAHPLWVNPDCSKQKKREVLDFRGDPCVPQMVVFFLPIQEVEFELEVAYRPIQRSLLLDPPPPKKA
jgi:hypothetical protein